MYKARWLVAFFTLVLLCTTRIAGADQTFTYEVYQGHVVLGTETGQISSKEGLGGRSRVEYPALGVAIEQKIAVDPVTRTFVDYQVEISTPQGTQALELSHRDGVLHYATQGLTGQIPLAEPVLILDNNIWCHYQLLIDRLELETGFVDSFRFIVPTIFFQYPQGFTMTVEVRERELVQLGDWFVECYHLFASSPEAGVGVNLWVNPETRQILRLTIPTQGVEVRVQQGIRLSVEAEPQLGLEVTIPSGEIRLPGTLLVPEETAPRYGVIFMHGSGSVDRNGNFGNVRTDLYKQLAEAAFAQGFASLRYDKRGVGDQDPNLAAHTPSELMADLCAAIDFLKANSSVEQVILVGHSEGGVLVPMVAARRDDVAGVVLLAAPARPLHEIIDYQVALAGQQMGLTEEQIQANLAIQAQFYAALREGSDWIEFLGTPYYAPYFQEHFSFTPLEEIQRVTVPVLILHGQWDAQVPVEDARALAQALQTAGNTRVKLVEFPRLDHLFMPATQEFNLAEYNDPSRKVAPEVIDAFLEWLATHF